MVFYCDPHFEGLMHPKQGIFRATLSQGIQFIPSAAYKLEYFYCNISS